MKVTENNGKFILHVPYENRDEVASLMAYRGLSYSTSASRKELAILFSDNPYSLCDIAPDVPALAPYKAAIEASRALNGVGSKRVPPGLELWDYQKADLDYLLERGGGILGDQPGLGKTPTAIVFANHIESYRTLIIVPASLRLQWAAKIREWSVIPNVKVSVMLNVKDGIHPTAHYQIISYNAATNPAIIKAIGRYKWKLLIADEAHAMKNADSIRTRAIVGNGSRMFVHGEEKIPAIATYCEHSLALTGTLLLNRPSECLAASTQVLTNTGWKPIVQVKISDLLWDGVEWVEHHGLLYQGCATTVSVGKISATPTHRFRAKSIWVSADEARQNTVLWNQMLASGSENLPFVASPGIRAGLKLWNVIAIVVGELGQRLKNYVKGPLFVAVPAERKADQKKQTQNTMKFAPTLPCGKSFSKSSKVYATGQLTPTIPPINTMGSEEFGFGLLGSRTVRCFWRILFLSQAMRFRGSIWTGSTMTGDMSRGTSNSLPAEKIKTIVAKSMSFKRDWTQLWRKSKDSVPVFDIANAGPRQRFTILTSDGPVISHNCYVLLRYFDWECIDFMGQQAFKERYNRQAVIKKLSGKRFNLESTSLESELQNRLRVNIMTRHEKKDVMKLMKPPRYEVVQLSETGAVKAALAEEGLLDIEIEDFQTNKNIQVDGHIAEVRRLMGVALAPQVAEYSADWLDGSDGEKLVIFGWHIEVLDILEEKLSRFGTVRIDGKVSTPNRQKRVDEFIDNPAVRVFIANMQSGGTGVDGLQAVCSRCFLAEPDWVPAQNEQAVSRLDRYGQKELVTAEIFVAPGSISEKILVKALSKLNVIHRVLDHEGV